MGNAVQVGVAALGRASPFFYGNARRREFDLDSTALLEYSRAEALTKLSRLSDATTRVLQGAPNMSDTENPQGQDSSVTLVEVVPPKRRWTVMVYFNADNNLAEGARRNLNELLRIGSTPEVQLLALIDQPMIGAKTYAFRGMNLDGEPRPPRVRNLDEQFDAGDPRLFTAFLKWGVREYPAENHCVIIWGHGAGWDEFDECRINARRIAVGSSLRTAISMLAHGKRPRLLAGTNLTVRDFENIGLVRRRDFLNNFELRKAIHEAVEDLRREQGDPAWKFDLLGFDSCLMGMGEVAGQVQGNVQYVIASESEIPDKSWPYTAILEDLHADPEMTPEEFGSVIVDHYIDGFEDDEDLEDFPATLAVLNMDRYDAFEEAMSKLQEALKEGLEDPLADFAIHEALRNSQSFFATSYVDIYDFCRRIVLQDRPRPAIEAIEPRDASKTQYFEFLNRLKKMAEASKGVMDVIDGNVGRENGFVFYERHSGESENSHGVSVFFPSISRCYGELEFSRRTKWAEFLQSLIGKSFEEKADWPKDDDETPPPGGPPQPEVPPQPPVRPRRRRRTAAEREGAENA
jgi:hypothetical protein